MNVISEEAGFLDGPQGPLFCVVTNPAEASNRGIVLSGGGWSGSSTNRNAVLVRMARAIAANGARAARFDWRGTGESAGEVERFNLEAPFFDDVATVARHLEATGSTSVAVSGICFGSWSALVAVDEVRAIDRAILISLPFPSTMTKADHKADRIAIDSALKMAWRPAVWMSLVKNPAMRQAVVRALRRKVFGKSAAGATVPKANTADAVPEILDRLVKRGVAINLIFGEQDLEYASYKTFTAHSPLPASVKVTVIPGDLSNFGTLTAQQAAIDAVVSAMNR